MRIRKYAKLAGLKLANTLSSTYVSNPQTVIQPHICQLNQSPWDVVSVPPDLSLSSYQVDEDDSFAGTSIIGPSYGPVKSSGMPKPMSVIGEEENVENEACKEALFDPDGTVNTEKREEVEQRKSQLGSNKEATYFCARNDGKSWYCKKRARNGYNLCDHHLAQVRMYKSLVHPSRKKSKKPTKRVDTICHKPRDKNSS